MNKYIFFKEAMPKILPATAAMQRDYLSQKKKLLNKKSFQIIICHSIVIIYINCYLYLLLLIIQLNRH